MTSPDATGDPSPGDRPDDVHNDVHSDLRDDLRDRWIESLLVSGGVPQDHSERIAQAMKGLDHADQAEPAVLPRTGFRSWKFVSLAATVLLMLLLLIPAGVTTPAVAAIERSLHVASERLTRRYLLQVRQRTVFGTTRTVNNDLYVQGNDRFVLRHPGLLPGRNTWLGRNAEQSWVVPAIGPVLTGDETVLSQWLAERGDLETPYLHVSTVLTRMMSRGFELQILDDERVVTADGTIIACQHVQARRVASRADESGDLPENIELWASRATGMAIRLTAEWKLPAGQPGRELIVLTWQSDETQLSDHWFSVDAHR